MTQILPSHFMILADDWANEALWRGAGAFYDIDNAIVRLKDFLAFAFTEYDKKAIDELFNLAHVYATAALQLGANAPCAIGYNTELRSTFRVQARDRFENRVTQILKEMYDES